MSNSLKRQGKDILFELAINYLPYLKHALRSCYVDIDNGFKNQRLN